MKNKEARIDTYSTPFCIDFIVANEKATIEELRELFCYPDDEELEDTWDNGAATTGILKRKSDGATVLLVRYIGKSGLVSSGDDLLDLCNTAVHEGTHVAMDIYNIASAVIDTENQEVFAYFEAYVVEKILKTLLNK